MKTCPEKIRPREFKKGFFLDPGFSNVEVYKIYDNTGVRVDGSGECEQ